MLLVKFKKQLIYFLLYQCPIADWKKEERKFCPFCTSIYDTLANAKAECKQDPNCNVIYDLFCDGSGYFCSCPMNRVITQTHPDAIDCIYTKNE